MNYDELVGKLEALLNEFDTEKPRIMKAYGAFEVREKELLAMAKERNKGFPTLANAYKEYFELQDSQLVNLLKFKNKPAVSASFTVAEVAKQRRELLYKNKILQYLVDTYEEYFPELIELKAELLEDVTTDPVITKEYTEEELQDESTRYLTREEYRKLGSVERNQMALDRYWGRKKTNGEIGRMYERYIGYYYESRGYDVEYFGIFKGLEDRGRDVIARKGNEEIIAQCKNWSSFKTIHEKHVFQLFGSIFQYKVQHGNGKNVVGAFYTTTKLSDWARLFATQLGVEVHEQFKMPKDYPCIKCNVSVKGDKIYHLPFDQQYDRINMNKRKGEFFCASIAEAEQKGFRRALRHHYSNSAK